MSDNKNFINQTMLTCLGNKRKLVNEISKLIKSIGKTLNSEKMKIVDGFSGSTVVSRKLLDEVIQFGKERKLSFIELDNMARPSLD